MMISNGSRSLVDTTYLPTYYRNSICLFLDQLLNNLHEVIEYRVHICIAKYFVFVLAQASYHENLFVYATLNSRHHRLFERQKVNLMTDRVCNTSVFGSVNAQKEANIFQDNTYYSNLIIKPIHLRVNALGFLNTRSVLFRRGTVFMRKRAKKYFSYCFV